MQTLWPNQKLNWSTYKYFTKHSVKDYCVFISRTSCSLSLLGNSTACQDKDARCTYLAHTGYCRSRQSFMMKFCQKSCTRCEGEYSFVPDSITFSIKQYSKARAEAPGNKLRSLSPRASKRCILFYVQLENCAFLASLNLVTTAFQK